MDVRAYARAGPTAAGEGSDSSFLAAALAPLQANSEPSGPRPWPNERFDLPDFELVELVEAFESAFGLPPRFSYNHHGPALRRALDRFDRFAEDRSGYTADGRRWRHGAGYRAAAALIAQRGALYRTGNRGLQKVRSLAYFVPKLDQMSKQVRRSWRDHHGLEVWGPTKEAR